MTTTEPTPAELLAALARIEKLEQAYIAAGWMTAEEVGK